MRFVSIFSLMILLFSAPAALAAEQGPEGGPPPAMPVVAETAKAERVKIYTEFSGRITAVDYVQVRPQVSGAITKVLFEDGARVKAGDVLFEIDPRPYEAAQRGAQANVETAENQLKLADKELDRAQGLIKTNAISKRSYDERVNARNVAAAQADAARAALEQAQINLDYARVKAPISGFTSRAEVTEGNLVDPISAPILTTIVSDAGVYADFDMDERTFVQQIRKGNGQSPDLSAIEVKVSSPSLPEKVFDGKIHAFDNRIDPASGTIRVRAYLANVDKTLVPGMFVRVVMGTKSEDEVILVPETAIGTDQNRKFVMVAESGKAVYRAVTLGAATEGKREVLSGLSIGEKVITEGLMHVRPGMDVIPMSAQEMAAQMAAAQQAAAGVQGQESAPEEAASESKPKEAE